MTPLEPIPQPAQQQLDQLGGADIVIGIPSFNNAETIGHVVRAAQQGLQQYFPQARGVIVNSDGGSKDGTPERVLGAVPEESPVVQVPYRIYPVHKFSTPYLGIPGKGSALRNIFQISRTLGAKACAVVDSDLRSISPEWIQRLVQPIYEQRFDFAAPYYLRHKFDGTITNSIVYPATRALYGRRIRQPIGGEFCFSPALIEHYLSQDVWRTDVARFGIDIWVTTQAVAGGFRVCQVFLGAKIHDPKDPGSDLATMLTQVLGAMLGEVERNASVWQKVRGSEPVPLLGNSEVHVDTEPVKVDVTRMIDSFRLGYSTLNEIWGLVLPPATLLELKRLSRRQDNEFRFADEIWVRIIYDFTVAYHFRTLNRDHLLRALTPLYLGWVSSFVVEMETADAAAVEERIEKLCGIYEAQKPYLISRWRWPDRFNP
jgi:hypothetical protein